MRKLNVQINKYDSVRNYICNASYKIKLEMDGKECGNTKPLKHKRCSQENKLNFKNSNIIQLNEGKEISLQCILTWFDVEDEIYIANEEIQFYVKSTNNVFVEFLFVNLKFLAERGNC